MQQQLMFEATVLFFFFYKGPTETHKAHGCQINNITTVNYQNQSYGSDSHHSDCLFADMQTTNKQKIIFNKDYYS